MPILIPSLQSELVEEKSKTEIWSWSDFNTLVMSGIVIAGLSSIVVYSINRFKVYAKQRKANTNKKIAVHGYCKKQIDRIK